MKSERHRHCDTNGAARNVIWLLGSALLYLIISTSVLVFIGKPVPDKFLEWGGLIIVGLLSLLAKTNSDRPSVQPVDVVNPPTNPVPIEESKH